MRSLPNMTVIVPADVDEAYGATLATLDIDGPVYMRLGGRVEEQPVTDPEAPFRLGRAVQVRPGKDVAVIACWALVALALCVAAPTAIAAQQTGTIDGKVRFFDPSGPKMWCRQASLDP
jgi:transketolase